MTEIKIVNPMKTTSLTKDITPYTYKEEIISLIKEYFKDEGLYNLFGGAGAKVFINDELFSMNENPKKSSIDKIEIRLYKIEHEFHPKYTQTRTIDGDKIGEWENKYRDF